jgi:hypothetical protein
MRCNDCALLFSLAHPHRERVLDSGCAEAAVFAGTEHDADGPAEVPDAGNCLADGRVQQVVGLSQTRVMLGESQVDKYEALALSHPSNRQAADTPGHSADPQPPRRTRPLTSSCQWSRTTS